MKKFFYIRHPAVNKKHPLGEMAPLTEVGEEQARQLAQFFKQEGVRLVFFPTEDLPRFSQTADEVKKQGIEVRRLDGISFKDLKNVVPLPQIVARYRQAGIELVERLKGNEFEDHDKIAVVGSWPLLAGMGLDAETLKTVTKDDLKANKPGFCTGVVLQLTGDTYEVIDPDLHPVD